MTGWIDPARRPFVGALLLALLHAVLFGLIFPPFGWYGLALVAPAPLIVIALRTTGKWRSAAGAMLGAAPAWLFHHAWIGEISAAGMPGLVAYLCLWTGLFVLLGARLAKRWPRDWVMLWAPLLWVALEFLRGEIVFHGYPWFMVGEWAHADSVMGRAGVYLTSMFSIPVAAAIAGICSWEQTPGEWTRARKGMWKVFVIVIPIMLILGHVRAHVPYGRPLRIGVVQTNVPQSVRGEWPPAQRVEDMGAFLAMTREVAAMDPPPDMIVWPETMFPGHTLTPEVIEAQRRAGLYYRDLDLPVTWFHDELVRTQAELGIPMVVGALGYEGFTIEPTPSGGFAADFTEMFNSVFVVANGAVTPQRYDKTHLTPFGEVMPYISNWEWLEQRLLSIGAQGMTFALGAGTSLEPLTVPVRDGREVRIATPICFEATMGDVVRKMVFKGGERRADLIVQVTNDGWFGAFTGGKEHHALLAGIRAVETRTPLVRAANTGISMAFDARGRVIEPTPPGPRDRVAWTGVFEVPIPENAGGTVFTEIGNAPAWIAVAGTAMMAFVLRRPARTEAVEPASKKA